MNKPVISTAQWIELIRAVANEIGSALLVGIGVDALGLDRILKLFATQTIELEKEDTARLLTSLRDHITPERGLAIMISVLGEAKVREILDWLTQRGGVPDAPTPTDRIRGTGFCADWNVRPVSYVREAKAAGCNTIMVDYPGTLWDCKNIQEFRALREPFIALVEACRVSDMVLWIALVNWNDQLALRLSPEDLQGEVAWMVEACRSLGYNKAALLPALEWPNNKIGGHESRARDLHTRCEATWPREWVMVWNKDARPGVKPDRYQWREWHLTSTSDQGAPGPDQVLVTDHGITGRQLGINADGTPDASALAAWISACEGRQQSWILYTHVWERTDATQLWRGIRLGLGKPA